MSRALSAGALLLAAAFLYTLVGGRGLGSRIASPALHLSISYVGSDARATRMRVSVRNHQSHPARGEVDYIVLDGESDVPVYRSPSTVTPLLAPGAETSVTVQLRQEDLASAEIHLRVRERLVYVDEVQFDRSRVTPFHSLVVGER